MSAGQIVGGVVGAVIGFYVGGPVGALQGAALGAGIGGYLDPPKGPTVSGPRLSDLSVQTSTYGAFIPRVYGTIAVHGNLLWLENNKLKERVRKEEQGGKGGGGGTTVKTYTYSATFALGLCQGPIAGVRRIWCGDKLLYNAGSDDLETIIASNQNAKGWRLYLGTDDQMPDPRYEADVGVGNAPAFRGIAYLVFEDFELADYSNTLQVAQFKVEIVNDAVDSVSKIYDVADSSISSNSSLIIKGVSGNIASIRPWVSSSDLPGFKSVHRTSGVYKEALGTSASGAVIYADPDLSCGDLDYVVLKNGLIHTSVGIFSAGISPSDSGLRCFYSGDRFAVLWLSGPGSRVIHLFNVASVISEHYTESSRDYIAIHLDGEHLYAVTVDEIVIFSASDLSELSSVSFSSSYSLESSVIYIGFWNGWLWILPYNNGVIQAFDPQNGVKVFELNSPELEPSSFFGSGQPGTIKNGIIYRQSGTSSGGRVQAFKVLFADSGLTPVANIIATEVGFSGLLSVVDLDVSLLSSQVRGYRVIGGTIRAALEPLQGAFPFDVIQSGYQIKCVPRGQSSVATIPWQDLGAAEGDTPGDMLKQSREMDSQLPARTTIKYIDAEREYAESEQYAERINTPAVNRVDREMPLVITADEAAGVAEVLQNLAWLERNELAFSLPPPYLGLEAADVVTISAQDAAYEVRITESNYTPDGRLDCKARPNRAALYTPNATGGESPGPDGLIPLAGESLFIPLDVPVVDETAQNRAGFIGAMTGYADSWPGALLIRSGDGGQTWADIQGYAGKASLARCLSVLPASNCTLIDARSVQVSSISGSWSSISRDQMLSGQHYAAYGADGRWEIVRYQSAALQADGTFLLSGFIRGERGTEWATGLHQVGDWFVPLDDPDLAFIGSPVESINIPFEYRGVTSGASYESASGVDFTYRGVNLECLSPVYAKAARDVSGNFSGSFTRRSRVTGTWWTTGVPTPVGEASEAYEIDVMSGSTVVRTIAVNSPSFTYSATDQTTDFGSAQSSITFRIYQLSAVVGRGYPLEVTL
nr:phage tail protein [Pseudomonas sp. UBA6718]